MSQYESQFKALYKKSLYTKDRDKGWREALRKVTSL